MYVTLAAFADNGHISFVGDIIFHFMILFFDILFFIFGIPIVVFFEVLASNNLDKYVSKNTCLWVAQLCDALNETLEKYK